MGAGGLGGQSPSIVLLMRRLSLSVAALERGALVICMALVLGLVLLNVITRSLNYSLFWVDEAAVFAMVWGCFIGASLLVHQRMDFAVTLLTDPLPSRLRHLARVIVDALVLGFGVLMLVLCWWWFDLPTLIASGWNLQTFFEVNFNGIYMDRPTTVSLPKWPFFLVMPWFSLTTSIHAVANLVEDVTAMFSGQAFAERHEAEI
jgi:TRAP-type C4-dicarboxylate transport system permease small subunit